MMITLSRLCLATSSFLRLLLLPRSQVLLTNRADVAEVEELLMCLFELVVRLCVQGVKG